MLIFSTIEVDSDTVKATLAANDAPDWLAISADGSMAFLDVRFTLKTDDREFIYVEYQGRGNMAEGLIAAGNLNLETGDLI